MILWLGGANGGIDESARLREASTQGFVRSDAGSFEGLFTAKLLLAA